MLIFALFPALYFFMAIFSKVDLGERHILLVYPFALLFVASLWKYAQQKRVIGVLFLALLVVNAVDVLRTLPATFRISPPS